MRSAFRIGTARRDWPRFGIQAKLPQGLLFKRALTRPDTRDERWHDDDHRRCYGIGTCGPNDLRVLLGHRDARPEPRHPWASDSGEPVLPEEKEDKTWEKERYDRVPILGPITSGGPPVALDPPSDDEVMRALEKAHPIQGGLPMLCERNRNNVRIVKDKIADYVDPPRVYPLVGPAQQHHAHYKCTIYYTDVRRIGWPVPYTIRDEEAKKSSTSTITTCTWWATSTRVRTRSSIASEVGGRPTLSETKQNKGLGDVETGRRGVCETPSLLVF